MRFKYVSSIISNSSFLGWTVIPPVLLSFSSILLYILRNFNIATFLKFFIWYSLLCASFHSCFRCCVITNKLILFSLLFLSHYCLRLFHLRSLRSKAKYLFLTSSVLSTTMPVYSGFMSERNITFSNMYLQFRM